MADGITFQATAPATPPSGFIAASDDCSAAGHAQIIKLAISADGSATIIPADATNGLDVDVTRLPAGTNVIGYVGLEPRTSGGLSTSPLISVATTNATSIKGSAGQVYGWYFYNANASTRFLKLYNKASAPTVGTDTPLMVIPIPSGAAANVAIPHGIAFSAGIALALTTGVANSDTGAVAANDCVVNLFYK